MMRFNYCEHKWPFGHPCPLCASQAEAHRDWKIEKVYDANGSGWYSYIVSRRTADDSTAEQK